jgi:hypothetical protein
VGVQISFLAEPDPARRASLEADLATHRTLEAAVRWGFAQDPVADIADVVVQDEFTHDVILPLHDGLVLVYDST